MKFAATAAAALLVSPLHAQFLDLDAGKPPPPGSGTVIRRQIDAIDLALETEPAADAIPARFMREVRQLALALLERSAAAGEEASAHAILAWRLLDSERQLLNLAERVADASGSDWERRAVALVVEHEHLRVAPPKETAVLHDWLRDRLCLLTEATVSPIDRTDHTRITTGWIPSAEQSATLDADFLALVERDDLAPGVAQALDAASDITTEADAFWAYRPNAHFLRAEILRAANSALDADERPSLRPAIRDQLRVLFERGVTRINRPATREAGFADLDGVQLVGEIGARVAELRDRRGRPLELDAITPIVLLLSTEATANRQRGAFALDMIDLVGSRYDLSEQSVVQQLRPAFRFLDERSQATERALLANLERVLLSDDATMDPELVGIIAAHRSATTNLLLLAEISKWLEQQGSSDANPMDNPRPGVITQGEHRLATRRVLSLARSLARGDTEAGEELNAFARDLRDLLVLPAEDELRATSDGIWDELTGDRRDRLIDAIDGYRSRWISAWARAGSNVAESDDPRELADRLRLIGRLLNEVRDGVVVVELDLACVQATDAEHPGLAAWPGFYVTPAITAHLRDRAFATLPRLTGLVTNATRDGGRGGRSDRAIAELRDHATDNSLIRLVARLHRDAIALDITYAHPLGLAGSAPTGDSWNAAYIDDLAAISRYLREAVDLEARGRARDADRIQQYLTIRADDLLARMP